MYPDMASRYFMSVLRKDYESHKRKIHSIAWNCTGQKLASGSVDKTVRVWTLDATGKTLSDMELKGHTDSVDQLCWNPLSREMLGTASGDKTVKIWDTRTGKAMQSIDTKGQNINIRWSPDGNHIVVGNKRDVLSLIDTRTWKIAKQQKFPIEVNEMAWSKSGQHFLITTGMGTVEVLKFPSFEPIVPILAHTGHCYCVEFDPRGRYVATGGADALVLLWDVNDLVCVRSFARLESPIRSLSFSHNGHYIASVAEDAKIDIADVETAEHVHSVRVSGEINCLAWNPKSLLLAFAGEERSKAASSARDSMYCVSVFGYAPS